jgi:hypothetical protein
VVEFFAPVQYLVDILPHYRVDLVQIIRELRIGILFRFVIIIAIPVVALFFLYDWIVVDELKGTGGLGNDNAPLVPIGKKREPVSLVCYAVVNGQ